MILLLLQLSASEYSTFIVLESSILLVFGICKCSCLPSSAEALGSWSMFFLPALPDLRHVALQFFWSVKKNPMIESILSPLHALLSRLLSLRHWSELYCCSWTMMFLSPYQVWGMLRHNSFGQLISFFRPRKSRNQWLSRLLLPLTCLLFNFSVFCCSWTMMLLMPYQIWRMLRHILLVSWFCSSFQGKAEIDDWV